MFEKIYNFTDFIWGIPLTILVIGTGLYLSIRTGFFQITGIKTWWRKTVGEVFSKKGREKSGEGELTPWQAITTVLGGTVGVGMVFQAFEGTWGKFGSIILCIAIVLFCYSGYLGFFVEFRTCTEWIVGLKASKFVNVLFFVLPILATLLSTLEVWGLCDMVVGLVIIPNLIALICLSPKFVKLFKEYKEKLKAEKAAK